MGYKHHESACYLVAWDEERIIKAGYSHCQRWRKFVARGARLIGVDYFTSTHDAFVLETALDAHLRSVGYLAFEDKWAAEPYLGTYGGGWMECLRVPCVADAVEECVRIATAHYERITARDARTEKYERTYADGVTFR